MKSNENCPAIKNPQREVFEVVQKIDPETGEGVIQDRQHYRYTISLKNLDRSCNGEIFIGESLSGICAGPTEVYDLAPDLQDSVERPNHVESVGPTPEVVAWEPKTGDSNYYCAGRAMGKSHDGRFSDGREVERKSQEEQGLDKLDQLLQVRIDQISEQQKQIKDGLKS